jgi:quercetin dioxygenase-like cupin family protein
MLATNTSVTCRKMCASEKPAAAVNATAAPRGPDRRGWLAWGTSAERTRRGARGRTYPRPVRLTITAVDGSPIVAGHPGSGRTTGGVTFGPVMEGGSLRLVLLALAPGSTLEWPARHGEEALYVLAGGLAGDDGAEVGAGGAVILHAGGTCTLRAVVPTRVAHFWSTDGGSIAAGPAERHVVGADGWAVSGSREASFATWFADSSCEGCDVTLMKVERDTPGNRGRAHTHSAEEIIVVIDGEIRLGAHPLPAGTAVHVPADTRYAVTCGERHHAFLNYRATSSTQHYAGDADPVPETALGRGGRLVDAPRSRP